MPSPSPRLPVGARLNGIYEIERFVADGGMGEVYKGFNTETRDAVAIKVMRPEFSANEDALALFRREAATLRTLHHEAIVNYFGFHSDPVLRRHYLAMEFVDGISLEKRLEKGPLPLAEVMILKSRIGDALQAAHRVGVVHRDISADNVILPNGDVRQAKLIDFGIARSQRPEEGTIIGNRFAGKATYASPEHVSETNVTAKSDIYSFGLVLAEALRGRPIEMGGTMVEIVEKRRRVPDLSDIDAAIRPLIRAMLDPDPAKRPADMAAVAAWAEKGTSWRGGGPSAPAARGSGGSSGLWLVLGLAVAAIAVVAATAYFLRDDLAALLKPSPTSIAVSVPTPSPSDHPPLTPAPNATDTPTPVPTASPTVHPTLVPAPNPPTTPTPVPTVHPTLVPAPNPPTPPTPVPTATPTVHPTLVPAPNPPTPPTPVPTASPTVHPTPVPAPVATPVTPPVSPEALRPRAPNPSVFSQQTEVGKPFQFQPPPFTDPTGQTLRLEASNALPEGLAFRDLGRGQGEIAGAAAAAGTFDLHITATNPKGLSASIDLSLVVAPKTLVKPAPAPPAPPPPVDIALNWDDAKVGQSFARDLPAWNLGDKTIQPSDLRAGAGLPTGLDFVDLGGGKGRIVGTPQTSGSFNFEVDALQQDKIAARLHVAMTVASPQVVASLAERQQPFLRKYDGGSCFFVLPTSETGGSLRAYAADPAAFRRFADAYRKELGAEAALATQKIDALECPTLSLARLSQTSSESSPEIVLNSEEVGHDKPLAGRILGRDLDNLKLLAVERDGTVTPLKVTMAADGHSADFSIPLTADPEDIGHTMSVLAVVSKGAFPALASARLPKANALAASLTEQWSGVGGAADAKFVTLVK